MTDDFLGFYKVFFFFCQILVESRMNDPETSTIAFSINQDNRGRKRKETVERERESDGRRQGDRKE